MKKIILFATSLFSIATLTSSANAAVPLQKIILSGTVEVQSTLAPDSSRVRVSLLNSARVFAEFAVSRTDYELVCDVNGSGEVELVPKSAGSGLPTIQVFKLNANAGIIDTKFSFGDVYSTLDSTATGNLFEGLTGAIKGRVSFRGPLSDGNLRKFSFSGLALGKNQNAATSTAAIIRLSVVTTGNFTQRP